MVDLVHILVKVVLRKETRTEEDQDRSWLEGDKGHLFNQGKRIKGYGKCHNELLIQ